MKTSAVTTMVLVQDMDRSVQFYRSVLGLTLVLEEEDWAMFEEHVGLMLSPDPLPSDNLSLNSMLLTLDVSSVSEAYNELIEKGVAFLVGPTDIGGATVATFRDPDGNLLQIVERFKRVGVPSLWLTPVPAV